jgi:alpha-glucosidase
MTALSNRWIANISLIVLTMFADIATAAAVEVASVKSPDQKLTVRLEIDDGRLAYRVTRDQQAIIGASRLGFVFQNAESLQRNLEFVRAETSDTDDNWELPWGESQQVRNHYQELRAYFQERTRGKRLVNIVFRVYDDGFGFRYEFPEQANWQQANIVDELTEFDVIEPATAWWIPAGEWNRYEYLYNRTALTEVSQAHTPITVRTSSGLHLSFHEAALVDYASMWLRRVEGQRLKAQLSNSSAVAKVIRKLPFHTPWRTVQIADHAGGLVESNLILNLNEPNKLGDVSWFKPSKYVGIWWSLHLDTESWASGAKHGATTKNALRMIDFAAKHGFRGVLIEGWNQGWDGDWFANGWQFDFTKPTADFDLPRITAYAKRKGVHLIGHHETACAVSHYERQLPAALDLYQRLGVDQVKTGYVCDAGQIEVQAEVNGPITREWHDGQWMSNHHLRVVEEAAKRQIAINAHEPIKDTGLRRTYPNWIAREGARGMEYNAWGNPPNPPEHEANLVFTRMLSGPMDFTPGVLSLKGRGGQAIQSTLAKQLATYVVIYSPIQMAADLPENYQKYLAAFQFIKDVPTDWRQTKVLNGEIGDFVTIARLAKHSDDWFVGAVTDEQARDIEIDFDFLPAGRYEAQIYRDADNAHYLSNPGAHVIEKRPVTSDDTLSFRLAAGGGLAMRLVKK